MNKKKNLEATQITPSGGLGAFSLLHLTDPTLPIGGFSHSSGLETYVQQGIVYNAATAKEFILQMLSQNIHYSDAAFCSLTFDAENLKQIILLDKECTALKIPKETRMASQKLGIRLLKIFAPNFKNTIVEKFYDSIKTNSTMGNYCIAFALCAKVSGIDKKNMLTGFYFNALIGLVTNAVKLVPLSQQTGQEIIFALQTILENLVEKNVAPNIDLLGKCNTSFDIKCMQHERLYSRLYMS